MIPIIQPLSSLLLLLLHFCVTCTCELVCPLVMHVHVFFGSCMARFAVIIGGQWPQRVPELATRLQITGSEWHSEPVFRSRPVATMTFYYCLVAVVFPLLFSFLSS